MKHEYLTLTTENASKLIQDYQQNGTNIDVEKYEVKKGSGQLYPENEIATLSKKILNEVETKRKMPSEQEKTLVEALGAKWFHEIVTVDNHAFSDPEFWLWLSVKYFMPFVEWRFRNKLNDPARSHNYGLTSPHTTNIKESLLYRMWIRAKLSYDESLKDPYTFTIKTNSVDLFQSFITRTAWGSIKPVANTFIRKRYEEQLKTIQYRSLGSTLTALHANIALEVLDHGKADKLIGERIVVLKKESHKNV